MEEATPPAQDTNFLDQILDEIQQESTGAAPRTKQIVLPIDEVVEALRSLCSLISPDDPTRAAIPIALSGADQVVEEDDQEPEEIGVDLENALEILLSTIRGLPSELVPGVKLVPIFLDSASQVPSEENGADTIIDASQENAPQPDGVSHESEASGDQTTGSSSGETQSANANPIIQSPEATTTITSPEVSSSKNAVSFTTSPQGGVASPRIAVSPRPVASPRGTPGARRNVVAQVAQTSTGTNRSPIPILIQDYNNSINALRCPQCGKSCPKKAKFCTNCGYSASSTSTQQQPAATRKTSNPPKPFASTAIRPITSTPTQLKPTFAQQQGAASSKIACTYCGDPLKENSKFCSTCGRKSSEA